MAKEEGTGRHATVYLWKQKACTDVTDIYSANASSPLIDGQGGGEGVIAVDGRIYGLLTMPMDVILEVASYLKPIDLLHLARVSSAFRKMLLSRSSRRIWAKARKNVVPEVPDGPHDLSEPLYARLLFERICMKCGSTNANHVDYANVHRYCEVCWNESMQLGMQLVSNSGLDEDPYFVKVIYDLLPAVPVNSQPGYLYPGQHPAVLHLNTAVGSKDVHASERKMYHRDDFAVLVEEYCQVCTGEMAMTLDEFVMKYTIRTQERMLFQTEIMMFDYDRRCARAVFGLHMTVDWKLAIEQRLLELDSEPEDYPAMNQRFHNMLQQPAALAPHVWRDIKPKILEILETERTRRADDAFRIKWFMRLQDLRPLYEAFVQATKEHYREDVWARTMPTFGAAITLPSMRTLLTSADPTSHASPNDFAAIRSGLMRDVREAKVKLQRRCANMLRGLAASVSGTSPSTTNTSTLDGQSASKGKVKGKARDLSEEIVEPEVDVDDLYADDPAAADRALLERPTSLFECAHPQCQLERVNDPGSINPAMTFLGLLQHVMLLHASLSWDAISVRPAANAKRALVPRLLDALGMPRGTTLSALHEQIGNRTPGRCSCGIGLRYPQVLTSLGNAEGVILTHMDEYLSDSSVGWLVAGACKREQVESKDGYNPMGTRSRKKPHNITLDPIPNGHTHNPFQYPRDPFTGASGSWVLNILEMVQSLVKQTAANSAAAANLPASLTVPVGPVGPAHPLVQLQTLTMAATLNEPLWLAPQFAHGGQAPWL